jgi:hypothetical protein
MKTHPYWIVLFLAWLLWVHSWSLKKPAGTDNWLVDSTYESQVECEKAAVKLAGTYDFLKERYKDSASNINNNVYKQVCLPQTVNPREPAEKPKEKP